MKTCKYCKESISEAATKCPKCQSFQSKYRNPNFVSLLFLLLIPVILIPSFLMRPSNKSNYMDYKDKITLTVIRKDTLKREECKDCDLLNILVEVDNQTAIEWEQAEYEIEFKTVAGTLLNIEKRSDFQLKLYPNAKAKSALKIPIYQEYSNSVVNVNLVSLRENWY